MTLSFVKIQLHVFGVAELFSLSFFASIKCCCCTFAHHTHVGSIYFYTLHINASKTREMVIDFDPSVTQTAPVNIQALDIEIIGDYKNLGVHLSNKLDWTHNTDVM